MGLTVLHTACLGLGFAHTLPTCLLQDIRSTLNPVLHHSEYSENGASRDSQLPSIHLWTFVLFSSPKHTSSVGCVMSSYVTREVCCVFSTTCSVALLGCPLIPFINGFNWHKNEVIFFSCWLSGLAWSLRRRQTLK